MSKKLRWGFLGAGGIAGVIATDFQLAGIQIQAVGAREISGAEAFADRFGIPNRHQGYGALVNDPEVDVVYISTIHPLHAGGVPVCARQGRPQARWPPGQRLAGNRSSWRRLRGDPA